MNKKRAYRFKMFFIISLICIFQVKKLIGLQNFKAISLLTVDGTILKQ